MEEEGRGEANMAKKMVGKGGESEHGSTCGKFYIVFKYLLPCSALYVK